MRRATFLVLAAVFLVVPTLGGAQTADDSQPAETPAAAGAQPASVDPDQAQANARAPGKRLLSPQEVGRQGLVTGVAEQPLRDFNLMQSRVPLVLQDAMADPYRRASGVSCDDLAYEIHQLNDALGPDLDEPVSTEHPGLLIRGEGSAKDYGYDALRAGVQTYIPFDRYIRLLSGADRHDHGVLAAIQAGAIRRAYLKGMGEVRGCPPPSTPRHLAHPVTVASDEETKPR
jgi:hypothetical protein